MSVDPKAPQIVLLVEDNIHNRRIFSGVLRHYGYEVHEAENGEQAVELAQATRPDIILMDLSLPVLDGWEATRRIKLVPGLANVPIIALTAHAMSGDDQRALEAGCDGYLSKPISPKRVVAEVERVLQTRAPTGE
ncbi:MAG: response regulator [Deltaproteobacteria bacterium]|nr:response regulator [Deltaproteobacteria bacterium]